MSRLIFRSALELWHPVSHLPPTFLLPIRARCISSTQQHIETAATTATTAPPPPPPSGPPSEASRPHRTSATIHAKATTAGQTLHPNTPRSRVPPTQPPPQPKGPISHEVKDMLPLLRAQPGGHYITLHIHGRPYLVTPGDELRLPFLMPGVRPGDVLRLNRASVLGSRDLTLLPTESGSRNPASGEVAYVDERLYECRAVVVGVDSEPMRTKEKTKRRNRKVKTVKSKHRYTVLRISDLRIKAPEELEE